jgi:hypothetical protein
MENFFVKWKERLIQRESTSLLGSGKETGFLGKETDTISKELNISGKEIYKLRQ